MSTLSVIRGGIIALAAVAAPSAFVFIALGYTWSSSLIGLVFYIGLVGIALALVAVLARACVRVAKFPPRAAVFLTTLPFIVLTLATLPALVEHEVLPVLFWAAQLAVAVFVSHTSTRRAAQ